MGFEIAVIGTSWGGLAALHQLLGALPSSFALPVVIVQHRHKDSSHTLPRVLQDDTRLCVCEVEDKSPITGGSVYIAPANYHVLVERGHLSLSTDEPVAFSRPSIDVTFNSAADTYRQAVVGVILTGANSDGSRGLKRIADRGGMPIVQRPETAESPTMPAAALRAVPAARSLTILEIAAELSSLPVGPQRRKRTGT